MQRLGKPFTCTGCGAQLVIERNYWLPISAVISFWFGRIVLDSVMEQALLFLGLLIIVALAQPRVMKPMVIEPVES